MAGDATRDVINTQLTSMKMTVRMVCGSAVSKLAKLSGTVSPVCLHMMLSIIKGT